MRLRVAVVGAGAAGLCAGRHLLSHPDRFAPPALFERGGGVGGTWCYEETVGTGADGRPVHSSMYRDLRTNLPKEVMMFPDFPFDSDLSSFLPHQEVRRYLERYCHHYGVRRHIRFGAAVEAVEPVVTATAGGGESTTWSVTWSDASGRRSTETFHCVFVCTGHYSDPHIPHIPGIENFRGQVLHSHAYRSPEAFSGRAVLVLGARASGLDISMELATAGAQVTLSHGHPPLRCPLPPGVQQRCPLVAVEDDGAVRFQDGSVGVAEVLLFCTGYNYSYPFLDPDRLGLEVRDQLVAPLYLHLMPPEFPSLFFIGVCSQICPFPHFHCQVRFCVAVLMGSAPLPPRSVMAAEARGELAARCGRGLSRRHLLRLDGDQWEYGAKLAAAAGFPPPPPALRSLYEEAGLQRRLRPQDYRRINYRLLGPDQWERLEPPDLEPLDPQDLQDPQDLLEPPDLVPLDPQDLLEPPDLVPLDPQDPQDLDPLDPQDHPDPLDLDPLDPKAPQDLDQPDQDPQDQVPQDQDTQRQDQL